MLAPIIIAACAVRLRRDDDPSIRRYFRYMLNSVARQTKRLPEPLYLAISGDAHNSIDTSTLSFDTIVLRPDNDQVWRQFEAYRHIVARINADYADRLDDVWIMFSDGDDLWNTRRYETVADTVALVHGDARYASAYEIVTIVNTDLDDAKRFVAAADVDAGIRDGSVEIKDRLLIVGEYTNFCVRLAVVNEFLDTFRSILAFDYADLFFAKFVATYNGDRGMTARYLPENQWAYFYRQHRHSVIGEVSVNARSDTRQTFVNFETFDEPMTQRIVDRNTDQTIASMISCRADVCESVLEQYKRFVFNALGTSKATFALKCMLERLLWWREFAKTVNFSNLADVVERITRYCFPL